MLLYCTFLVSITARMWSNLGMSWCSSCSLLSISQVELIFPITMLFPTLYYQFIFFNYSKKGLWPKRNFAAILTKDLNRLQLSWGRSFCVKWSQNLVSRSSKPPIKTLSSKLSTWKLLKIQPHQEFLSNLKSILGQQNLLLLELKAPLSSMSTAANHNTLPSVDKST